MTPRNDAGGGGADRPSGARPPAPAQGDRGAPRPLRTSRPSTGTRPVGQWRGRGAAALPPLRVRHVVVETEPGGDAERVARWAVRHFAPDGESVPVEVVAASGRAPARRLVEEARCRDAGLIVTRLPRRTSGILAACTSTPEEVASLCRVPVLVVKGEPAGPPRRILVPVGPRGLRREAARWVDELRRRFGAEVVAVHVVDLTPPLHPEHERFQSQYLRELRTRLREQLREAGVPPEEVRVKVMVDEPARGIVAASDALGADLVVLGNHGAGRVERFLLASVAGRVMRGVSCPVLLVSGRRASTGTSRA